MSLISFELLIEYKSATTYDELKLLSIPSTLNNAKEFVFFFKFCKRSQVNLKSLSICFVNVVKSKIIASLM